MSIRSSISNITHTTEDKLTSILTMGKTRLDNIVGKTTTALSVSNIWSGGFTGMSEDGIANLKSYLSTYCEDIQATIDGFDQTGDITSALRGDVQTAAYDFIDAIKKLLQAYVSTMRQEIDEADEAYKNYTSAAKSIAADTTSDASDIRKNADSIRLD